MIYSALGETRFSFGATPTDRLYTGQYEAEAGLYFYNARWYDNQLGRFAQADSIVPNPGNPQSWDRYAYVNNNPIRYSDPSGRYYEEDGPGRKNNTPIPPPNIIIFSGNGWTADAKNNINNAANIYGGRLLPYAIREMQRFIHMGVYDGPINLKNGARRH